MGTVYCGPYAESIGYGEHEGYAARILPDGTETGTWTYETREFTGHRAPCTCGWRGTTTYRPTERGQELADEGWDHDHLRPLIQAEAARHTVPATKLLALVHELRSFLSYTADERGVRVLTDRSRGALDVVYRCEQLLDEAAGREGQ